MSLVGVGFAQAASGMGTHADLVDPKNIRSMARLWVITNILYAFDIAWVKLSLLLMYYRIFRIPFFKLMSWILGSFVVTWAICVLFLSVFACTPMQKAYSPDLPGRCNNHRAVWAVHSVFTTLTDIIILGMPIVKLWSLRLKTTEKVGLTLAFSLGFLYDTTPSYGAPLTVALVSSLHPFTDPLLCSETTANSTRATHLRLRWGGQPLNWALPLYPPVCRY